MSDPNQTEHVVEDIVIIARLRCIRINGQWTAEPADFEGQPGQWTAPHRSMEEAALEAIERSQDPSSPWSAPETAIADGPWLDEMMRAIETDKDPMRRQLAMFVLRHTDPEAEDRAAAAQTLARAFGISPSN